jgi:hypothetical protein
MIWYHRVYGPLNRNFHGRLRPDPTSRMDRLGRRDAWRRHVDPRYDDRQRRPRHARQRPSLQPDPDPVGDHRLHAFARRRDPGHRLGVAPLRRQTRLHHLVAPVHARLAALRARDLRHRADPVPGAAGLRRRHDHAAGPDHHGRRRRSQADGSRDGPGRRADDARSDPWPALGRHDHPDTELALDLLREPGGRRDRRSAGDQDTAGQDR